MALPSRLIKMFFWGGVKDVREGQTGPTAAHIAQITVNNVSSMKEFYTWHLSIQDVGIKQGFARTGCSFTEESHAINVRISPDVFPDVPVLQPWIDLQLRACSKHRHLGGHDLLNKRHCLL